VQQCSLRKSCKIRGHEASECRKLKREKEEAAQSKGTTVAPAKPAASAKVAVADPSDDVVHVFTAFTAEPIPCDNKAFALGACSAQASQRWIVDSGASRSMSCNCEWFYSFTTLARPIRVTLGDNSAIPATGVGRIPVRMRANSRWSNAVLQDVLFIPELNSNLLSVAHLTQRGADVRFTGEGCQLYTQAGKLTCSGQLQGKLYIMDMRTVVSETARIAHVEAFPAEGDDLPVAAESALIAHSTTSKANTVTWHCRLAHRQCDTYHPL
jgi:hypothetical protein